MKVVVSSDWGARGKKFCFERERGGGKGKRDLKQARLKMTKESNHPGRVNKRGGQKMEGPEKRNRLELMSIGVIKNSVRTYAKEGI